MSAVYNFNEQIEGNTLEARVFAIKRLVSEVLQTLVGATVTFKVFRSKTSKVYLTLDNADNGGVTIIDAENCIFRINEIQNPTLVAGRYFYSITITYSDGDVKTYLGGEMPIVKFLSSEPKETIL